MTARDGKGPESSAYVSDAHDAGASYGLKALVAKLRNDGKADSTIRNTLVLLREMLGHAVDDGLIPANVAAGIARAKARRRGAARIAASRT